MNRLKAELKQTGIEKERLAKQKDELTRESRKVQHAVKNPKFDIAKFMEKDDAEFYTGLPQRDVLNYSTFEEFT